VNNLQLIESLRDKEKHTEVTDEERIFVICAWNI